MSRAQSWTGAAPPLLQQAPQSSPHIAIHPLKHVGLAVLEISIPATQGAVHVGYDGLLASPIPPRCFRSYLVLQFLQAFLPWPFHAPLEVIPKEIEPSRLARVHHSRLLGMQGQSRLLHPRAHHPQGLLRLSLGAAQDHEVICIAHHLPSPFG